MEACVDNQAITKCVAFAWSFEPDYNPDKFSASWLRQQNHTSGTENGWISKKKRIRAGPRASTTRILGQIDSCLAAVPFEASKVTQCKQSLESKLQACTTLDDEILDLTDDDGAEAEIVQANEVKESIYRALSQLFFTTCCEVHS